MGLVGGVLVLSGIFLVVGYCLLASPLRGVRWPELLSYWGLAFLVGGGAVAIVLQVGTVAGARPTGLAFAVVAGGLAAAGIAAAAWVPAGWWRRGLARPVSEPASSGTRGEWVATGLAGVVIAILILAVVGGFHSSPWLDDTWTTWLPRGLSAQALGLDPGVFGHSQHYKGYASDYPLAWSLLLSSGQRFVGATDLRAADGQLAITFVAFVAAAGRLLWGWARPWIVWLALLLLAGAPELLRQTGSGGADVPLAAYLSLSALAAALWLASGDRFLLALAGAFAAVALLLKSEGAPQVLVFTLVLTLFGLRAGKRRLFGLWAVVLAPFVIAAPWLIWRLAHGVQKLSGARVQNALSPAYLLDRTPRIGPSAEMLARHLTNPKEWLVIVPLAIVLSLFVALRRRRVFWLAPAALIGFGYVFWIWIYWADPADLQYRLGTSSYRVVDALIFTAALALPLLAESAWRSAAPGPARPRPPSPAT